MDFKFNLIDNGIQDLTQYNIASKELKDDIRNKKIPYSEVIERKKKLFDLIPTCWIVDDFGLYALIDDVYANDPEHQEYTDNLFGRNLKITND